ncbi:MAG: FecR family protein [Chitinophagaceae bacterium]
MSRNKIWELTAKKLSGEASEEELTELENLLRSNPEMHYQMQTVADLWHQATPDTEDAHQAFQKHAARMKDLGIDIEPESPLTFEDTDTPVRKKYMFVSLAFIVVAVLAYYGYNLLSPKTTETKSLADKSEVSTKYGSRTDLKLPDGTHVWLNAGSKLTYDKTYGNVLREVSLSGEAFFDVVKNPSLPFVIHTSNIDIKVLGTAFNVKSFPGEKTTETSLLRGSIEVTFRNRLAGKIILKPNEKLITSNEDTVRELSAGNNAVVDKSKNITDKEKEKTEPMAAVSHLTYAPADSAIVETSWVENKLIFRSEKFEDLAIQMERWYGVKIRFADEAIKPKKLNGIFENETIQQALKALQLITPFNYKMNKNDIIISSK